ncbi:MAG: CoA ester lyase [Beijerinckiaceae bacterium]
MEIRPRRSLLFSPAANPRALEKAKTLAGDGLIFDLEDSAAPEEKPAARARIVAALADPGYGPRERLVRINGLDTPWGEDDLRAAVAAGADGIVVPKIVAASDVSAAARLIAEAGGDKTLLWTMIETARALLDIGEIARTAALPECRFGGFILGTNDIARETRVAMVPGRGPMLAWLGQCVLAARAYGHTVIDSVYNDFRDTDGLRAECVQGAAMGMDGKTVIHPAQINIVNEVFSPAPAEVAAAERIVAAFELPENRDKAVISIEGRMVERLHAQMAERTLGLARSIAAMARN